ncbi:MAG: NADPH-dependent assimilatory sulfite reductase hemoprotein subunit [Thermoguttaceae bacterium]
MDQLPQIPPHLPTLTPPSPLERIKADSHFLRGRIAEELAEPTDHFSDETTQLLKYHGMYQQADRDRQRQLGSPAGRSERVYSLMVRVALPGGRLSSDHLLAQLDLCDELAQGTLRITTRQDVQIHGVPKRNIREMLRRIHQAGLTTMSACGDVRRNVVCCPAPYYGDPVHGQMQWMAHRLAAELAPRMPAYREIWLDPPAGDCPDFRGHHAPHGRENGTVPFSGVVANADGRAAGESDEPFYGPTYLPRKFKIGVGLPGDNCVDLYTHDVGLMGVCENFNVVGYNVLVGGGMGMTPARKDTFPALARRMAFATVDQTVEVVRAIMQVFRDHGNRSDRRHARLKYLLADWGLERLKAAIEAVLGYALPGPRGDDVWDVDDHVGWHEQGDGRWFYGLLVPCGRIADDTSVRLKSALREICRRHQPALGLTAGKSILLCDIRWEDRPAIEDLLRRHGVKLDNDVSNIRRWSTACVALPSCSMAITESERVLSGLVDQLEVELARLGLARDVMNLRLSGCPNGCSRPYGAEIGLVGRSPGRYAIYLGGRRLGNRLGFLYRDGVPLEQIVSVLVPVLAYFKLFRTDGEPFGDFCARKGADDLRTNSTVA